ncbi:serine protease HTRA4-like isoform X1 [Ciona intestinalis]
MARANTGSFSAVKDSVNAVVRIFKEGEENSDNFLGSGFFFKHACHLLIITNSHVLQGGGNRFYIHLWDGCICKATRCDRGCKSDLAALRIIDDYKSLNKTDLAIANNNYEVEYLDLLFAIGAPGKFPNSISCVTVMNAKQAGKYVEPNHRNASRNTYIQYAGSTWEGSSGGPLVNSYGKVVGVVSCVFQCSFGFAIPHTELLKFLEQDIFYQNSTYFSSTTAKRQLSSVGVKTNANLEVVKVEPGCGADIKGVRVGYKLDQINDQKISTPYTMLEIKNPSFFEFIKLEESETVSLRLHSEFLSDESIENDQSYLDSNVKESFSK